MSVNYTLHYFDAAKPPVRYTNSACFSSLRYCGLSYGPKFWPDYIVYDAVVRAPLNENPEALEYYCKYLETIFLGGTYKYEINKKQRGTVTFTMLTKGMKHSVALLQLTLARYVDEFSAVPIEFYKRATDTSDWEPGWSFTHIPKSRRQLFAILQQVHAYFVYDPTAQGRTYYCFHGHGAIIPRPKADPVQQIEYDKYRERLEAQNMPTVNAHFVP